MSTNKSENLGLHLWEAEDDFLRTEFNENFEKIDEFTKTTYRPENKPYVCGSVRVPSGAPEGTVAVTFEFEPSCVMIYVGDTAIIPQNGEGSVHTMFYYSEDVSHKAIFQLRRNQLILDSLGGKTTYPFDVAYTAFR